MSAVERLETGPAEAPSIEAELIEQPEKGRAKLRPLMALAPYVAAIAAGRRSPSWH